MTQCRSRCQSSLQKLIDINIPIIYINDYDFARVDEIISLALKNKKVYEWNPATGVTDFKSRQSIGGGLSESLAVFLRNAYTVEVMEPLEGFGPLPVPEKYLLLREIQDYIEAPEIKTLLELIAQRKLYDRRFDTTVIISSSVLKYPVELEKYISFLEIPFPSEDEINDLIDWHIMVNGYNSFKDEDRQKLLPDLKGLTSFEIDRTLDVAMSCNGTLSAEDKDMIIQQKKLMVRKSGVLDLIETKEKIDNIGGIEALKKYLKAKAEIYSDLSAARAYGVAIPKGVFLVGMPGCGKSLCAKASAVLFESPLLKMDMGKMMGKYVGESEANLRKALKIAEAAAPCVLWIDEIEKAFSGVGGRDDVLTRLFGYFLGWMQDKESAVYVIATANNADALPPELKRKGRFDEIFCINLPNQEERKAIFKVHINKRLNKQQSERRLQDNEYNLSMLAKATVGFNGADIESVVNDTVERCYLRDKKSSSTNTKESSSININDFFETIQNTVSISKSCRKQIDAMKNLFAENCFKDATTGDISSVSKK